MAFAEQCSSRGNRIAGSPNGRRYEKLRARRIRRRMESSAIRRAVHIDQYADVDVPLRVTRG